MSERVIWAMDMMEVRGGGEREWCGLLSCHIASRRIVVG